MSGLSSMLYFSKKPLKYRICVQEMELKNFCILIAVKESNGFVLVGERLHYISVQANVYIQVLVMGSFSAVEILFQYMIKIN